MSQIFIVNVGSEGKEHFHRPLRIGPNGQTHLGSAGAYFCKQNGCIYSNPSFIFVGHVKVRDVNGVFR